SCARWSSIRRNGPHAKPLSRTHGRGVFCAGSGSAAVRTGTERQPFSVRLDMTQSSLLPFGPLDGRTAHLCIDMQNLFAEDTPWHTPWMKRVLPAVIEIAERHAVQTVFTRFIPARHPDELPGSWR